jgi:hypothetical protein
MLGSWDKLTEAGDKRRYKRDSIANHLIAEDCGMVS